MGMLSAFAGILMTVNNNIPGALVCLMAAGAFDLFDGPVARTMERTMEEKRFGIQIDSLSDLVGFGILPALILYQVTDGRPDGILVAALYALCALIRLSYFNVMEEIRQSETAEARTDYSGLPVTVAAVLIPLVSWFQNRLGMVRGSFTEAVMLFMAICFLLPIKIKKPHSPVRVMLSVLGIGGIIILIGGR